jgi:hypothetical protein
VISSFLMNLTDRRGFWKENGSMIGLGSKVCSSREIDNAL